MKENTNNSLYPTDEQIQEITESYFLGRKVITKQKFTKKQNRTFDALYQAESYLDDLGYSFGSLSGQNVAVKKGNYDLPQKWHNLDKEDIESIDGVIMSLDYRDGEVIVILFKKYF